MYEPVDGEQRNVSANYGVAQVNTLLVAPVRANNHLVIWAASFSADGATVVTIGTAAATPGNIIPDTHLQANVPYTMPAGRAPLWEGHPGQSIVLNSTGAVGLGVYLLVKEVVGR